MLIETEDNGGGDGGGEDFSLGGEECPKEMPCIDCGDACKSDVNKATCPYDWGKCEDDRKANVKCVGDMWDYEDYASLKCSKTGGGEDYALSGNGAECPIKKPNLDSGDSCKPEVNKKSCRYDEGMRWLTLLCNPNGKWGKA